MSGLIREKIAENVYLNTVKTSKFKTMRITLLAFVPMKKETAYLNALVSRVLTRACAKYPDFTLLSKALSGLYGAGLSASSSKIGDRQCIGFHVAGLDDRYTLNGEILSEELSKLLCEVVFNPKIQDGLFDDDDVAQAKRETIESIDSDFNEKRIYSLQRALGEMCCDEAYGLPKLGTKEQVENATNEQIIDAWKNLIKEAKFEFFYVGDSDSKYAKEILKIELAKVERYSTKLDNLIIRKASKVKEITEEMKLSQSKMILGFRTDCGETDDDVYATKLMCAILGGTAHSKFFNNVREKLSLCYYCISRYVSSKGIMIVESGIEKENIDKAREAILNEIEDMKNGIISDFEIEATKLSVTNAFKESLDLSSGVEGWYKSQLFDSEMISVEDACDRINKITKDEIVKVANKLTLDTVYTLVGNGEE